MLTFKTLSIMKTRLLKITLSFAMLFIAAGIFAQNQPYTEMSGSSGDATTDMVTISDAITKAMPYYVEPDNTINDLTAAYDPEQDPVAQGVNTTFEWDYAGGADTTHVTSDESPYIEISFTEIGTFQLSVTETAPGGGCAGDPVTMDIQVVDEPSFEVTAGTENDTVEICDRPGESITVSSIADNGLTAGDLKFEVDSLVQTIDAEGNELTELNNETVYPAIPEDGNLGGTDVEVFTHDLVSRNGEITRYSFTFNGISDHISRKTDFIANGLAGTTPGDGDFNYYPQTDGGDALVYIVYPTPETGEIYYVPNDYDL